MPSKTKSAKKAPRVVIDTNDPRFKLLLRAVNACWSSIGSDCEAASWEVGKPLTNEIAVEACLDANRLTMYPGGASGKASNDYVREVCALKGGYDALFDAVKHSVRLA